MSKAIHKRNWVIVPSLVLLPIVGIPLALFSDWNKRNKAIAVGLSGLFFLYAIGSSEKNKVASTSTNTAPQVEQQSVEAKPVIAKVGEEVSISDRSITVLSVRQYGVITSDNEFIKPATPKGKFIVAIVKAKNTSNETGNLMFSRFELKDSKGRQYSTADSFEVAMLSSSLAPDKLTDDIPPGLTSQVPLIFDVAPDAQGLTLEWKGKTIDLGV